MYENLTIELLSKLFKLLNDQNRLKIIFIIGKDSKPVSEIIRQTKLSKTLVSFHLRPLRENGILSTELKGAFIYYRLTEPGLVDILTSMGGVLFKQGTKEEEPEFMFPPVCFMRQWMKGDR